MEKEQGLINKLESQSHNLSGAERKPTAQDRFLRTAFISLWIKLTKMYLLPIPTSDIQLFICTILPSSWAEYEQSPRCGVEAEVDRVIGVTDE